MERLDEAIYCLGILNEALENLRKELKDKGIEDQLLVGISDIAVNSYTSSFKVTIQKTKPGNLIL